MTETLEGGCSCRAVRYRLKSAPMFVNCCHCTWCQRETGTAFALNSLIETARLEVTGEPEPIDTPSNSGQGQAIFRCPQCKVALWSHYGGFDKVAFVRSGTLDTPGAVRPGAHIFTSTKLPWVVLDDGAPVFEAYYKAGEVWPAESLTRRKALFG